MSLNIGAREREETKLAFAATYHATVKPAREQIFDIEILDKRVRENCEIEKNEEREREKYGSFVVKMVSICRVVICGRTHAIRVCAHK